VSFVGFECGLKLLFVEEKGVCPLDGISDCKQALASANACAACGFLQLLFKNHGPYL